MRNSLPDRAVTAQRKPLACSGETVLRKLEIDAESRRLVGRLIERAIEIAGMSKKAASLRMGLSDDGVQVSRWCAGTEPPSLVRLASVPALACGLAVALAELADAEVRTVISMRRTS